MLSCVSRTHITLSVLSHSGRISQRGDTASVEEPRCMGPWVEDSAQERVRCRSGHDEAIRDRVCAIRGDCASQREKDLMG